MAHRCLSGCALQYLATYCVPVSSIAARQRLRSAVRHQLVVPSHRLSTYVRRAFAIAGPTTWNSLPTHLRRVENSTAAFGQLLKTHFFLSTSVYSALGVSAIMRYINRRFTYLLTSIIRRTTSPICSHQQPAFQHAHQCMPLAMAIFIYREPWRIGDRAFSVAAPHAWNRLPTELKLMRSSATTSRRQI